MKRIGVILLAALLSVSMGATAFAAPMANESQISKNNVYKEFTYSIYREGICLIRRYAKLDSYKGTADHVKLPVFVRQGSRKIPVSEPPSRYKKPKKIKKITLEGRLLGYGGQYRGQFAKLPNLKAIQLKKSDKDSYTKGGVLFDDYLGGIWLNVYPRGKEAKRYRIPKKVAVIGPYAFANSKKLKTITLPEGLLEINDHAFYGCKSLKKLTIPKWVNYIGSGAFGKCKTRVTMSPYMKKVKDQSKEGFHYELFVDCRLKDAPDMPIQQIPYRDMDEIQPDEKELHMTAQGRHTLVTHFREKENWYTLASDGLKYRSSNPDVAEVDDHGVITAKKKGTAKITVTHLYLYEYHNYTVGKYTVNVTVN